MKTWSVTAENMMSATAAASRVATADAKVRSAASAERVSTNRRYQPPSRSAGSCATERKQRKPWRAAARVPRHEGQSMDQRERLVGRVEVVEHIRHRREHGEPGPPARLAVPGAEVDAGAHDVAGRDVGVEQPEDGLGDDQRDALLQSLLQAVHQVARPVGPSVEDHGDPAIINLDRVCPDVVSPRIERAARAQVEAGVVPMARHQATLDSPTVERKAHVRTPIVEREGCAFTPEDTDRLGASLAGQAPDPAQLLERPNRHTIAHRRLLNHAFRRAG